MHKNGKTEIVTKEIIGEFRIVGYVDDIEVSVIKAKKQKMPQNLIDDMNKIHGDLVEIEPYLTEQEAYNALTDAVGNLIVSLLEKCWDDDPDAIRNVVDKLRQNVDGLKTDLTG